MKNKFLLFQFLVLLIFVSCSSDDDSNTTQEFAVAFENPSLSFSTEESAKEVKLVFSRAASESGTASITYTTVNAEYGTDFTTDPAGESGTIEVPVTAGSNQVSFTFNKLQNAIEGTEMAVTFKLNAVSIPESIIQGNTSLTISFTESAALGGVIAPEVGGPDQPNQVYVDLSAQTQTAIKRDTWDLGFYSGDAFRVVLNGSLYMAAGAVEATDIDAITEADVAELQPKVAVGTPGSDVYIDAPSGDINATAIAEVSASEAENKVYLLNLGLNIGANLHVPGGSRGWKKIRVLRQGDDYVMQYADLNATTHTEVIISKKETHNFTFFSFASEAEATVEPAKEKWDLNFTVFTNITSLQGVNYAYGYSDFITSNLNAGVQTYEVATTDYAYESFTKENVSEGEFLVDQGGIGSNWRVLSPSSTSLKDDVFFVLKDMDGNYYKIRFIALVNESGERGYPKFEYSLL